MLQSIYDNFRRIALPNSDPNQVIEVRADDYTCNFNVLCQDDWLVLYKTTKNDLSKLDIVLQIDNNHTFNKAFSIYRTTDEVNGQLLFQQFRSKIPLMIQCVPDIETNKYVLQNVSQIIREKPSWSTAHVAAHFGYTECFKNKLVQSQVNMVAEDTLMTPLHVAVKACQIGAVISLVDLEVRMDVEDINGDTVFHYAAATNKDIIIALTRRPVDTIINRFNNQGCTPYHTACMVDRYECVMEFLKAGVDVNLFRATDELDCPMSPSPYSESRLLITAIDTSSGKIFYEDVKNGGTPLHWAKVPQLTEVLLEQGCNVNGRNFQGDTALHVMVRRNCLSCAVMLLSHQADIDAQNADGNTPLHLAVKTGDLSLVQTFITFGANIDIVNNFGETARHVAATEKKNSCGEILYALHIIGASRCQVPMHTCNDGCLVNGQFNGVPPENCSFSKVTETHGILSVFLMGCLNSKTGKWCTVTKVPGGDDETLERLNKNLEMNIIGKDSANVPNWFNIHKNHIPDFVSKNPKLSQKEASESKGKIPSSGRSSMKLIAITLIAFIFCNELIVEVQSGSSTFKTEICMTRGVCIFNNDRVLERWQVNALENVMVKIFEETNERIQISIIQHSNDRFDNPDVRSGEKSQKSDLSRSRKIKSLSTTTSSTSNDTFVIVSTDGISYLSSRSQNTLFVNILSKKRMNDIKKKAFEVLDEIVWSIYDASKQCIGKKSIISEVSDILYAIAAIIIAIVLLGQFIVSIKGKSPINEQNGNQNRGGGGQNLEGIQPSSPERQQVPHQRNTLRHLSPVNYWRPNIGWQSQPNLPASIHVTPRRWQDGFALSFVQTEHTTKLLYDCSNRGVSTDVLEYRVKPGTQDHISSAPESRVIAGIENVILAESATLTIKEIEKAAAKKDEVSIL